MVNGVNATITIPVTIPLDIPNETRWNEFLDSFMREPDVEDHDDKKVGG